MCFEISRSVDDFTGNARIRQRAINKYYEDPQICKYCGKVIKVPCGTRPGYIRIRSFCNHSCSAKYNNTGVRRHGESSSKKCNKCGITKDIRSDCCIECKKKLTLLLNNNKTLLDIMCKESASRAKWNILRRLARQTMELSDRDYKCEYCEFDVKLHVAHIKPISSFSLDTLVGVVNDLDNLKYMCPNHHVLFDHGFIDIKGNKIN
jgi:hypothetical protein